MRYLFDRLSTPGVVLPQAPDDKIRWLRDSISTELQRLVTRQSSFYGLQAKQSDMPSSILNFGIPDITNFSATIDRTVWLSRLIKEAILKYEPRLIEPSVDVEATGDACSPAQISIRGRFQLNGESTPFHERLQLMERDE